MVRVPRCSDARRGADCSVTTPRDDETQQAPDQDGDPGQLNPRDLRDVDSEDGARQGGEPDADPEQLNPRDS